MAVGFGSYEIARSGLTVNERGLYVTGHNISNVNTPGYVRQQLIATNGPLQTSYSRYGMYQIGLGADIQQIRQIRHMFLDNIYRSESTNLGYWETRSRTLQDIQAILGEPLQAGLQNVLNQFWDAWQELSKEPDSLTVRALVRQRAEALVHHLNHMGSQLEKMQKDLDSEIRVRIDEINQITSEIAKLNVEIMKMEVTGDRANDLRDRRNLLLDRLTRLADVQIVEMQDGQVDITLGGYFLVTKGQQTSLYAAEANAGGIFVVPKLEGTEIEVPVKSGILKGLLESRGEVFGAKGSPENGSPYSKTDVTFVIDVSSGSGAYLDRIKSEIASFLDEIDVMGSDFVLNLVTYGGPSATAQSFTNVADFINALNALSETGTNNLNMDEAISALESLNFRQGAGRYALVFTDESIDGDGTAAADSERIREIVNRLGSLDMTTSVITNRKYFSTGDASQGEIAGWQSISAVLGGRIYDLDSSEFGDVMARIALDIVNGEMSRVPDSGNILPDIIKKLNALVNILAREVNYLHRSGKTLNGLDGEDFFVVIDPAYPMSIGNIKLNDNLLDLNNIVASARDASGDNTIAREIANLRHVPLMTDLTGIVSMDEYYQSIILSIGTQGMEADRIAANQLKLVESADNQRQAIMGVSMDEELSSMMKYKFAYDAAARVLNVLDEMMETVILRTGLSGR